MELRFILQRPGHAGHLLEQLQRGCAPGSPFWQAHGSQQPHVPFFSYVTPLVSSPGGANSVFVHHVAALQP